MDASSGGRRPRTSDGDGSRAASQPHQCACRGCAPAGRSNLPGRAAIA